MKKETKFSIIVFIVVVLVAYVTLSFVPDEMLEHSTINGSLLSFLGTSVVKAIGMRAVVAVAIALIVTLLIRIVDTEEKLDNIKMIPNLNQIANLVYNTSGLNVETTIVNGEILMENKQIKHIDVDNIIRNVNKMNN